jgi:UDP-N-acetylmuramyl tripeptide synthase
MNSVPTIDDIRLGASVGLAKVAALAIQRLGKGGGTSAPGLVAERIDPTMLTKLTSRLTHGSIVIAGTNGKTTTSRMVADIFTTNGMEVVHNRSGSNLVRGVVSAFVARASITGNPGGDVAVIEADEAAFPDIVRLVRPRVILLNNLFRDQLDRYGELDTIAKKWTSALATVDPSTMVLYNADDPGLAEIVRGIPAHTVPFGLTETRHVLDALPHSADSAVCRNCGASLTYRALFVSHLGDWVCPACGHSRSALEVAGHSIELHGVDSLQMRVDLAGEPVDFEIGVPGLYNAYNLVAAVAAARAFDVPTETIGQAMRAFRSAFGRIERVSYRDRQLTIALVKNPVGFNEVLRMLTANSGELHVPTLIAINDKDADGRDVSWLWDVDFEMLARGTGVISTTGIRGTDMANRLKYADVQEDRIHPLPDALAQGLDGFVNSIPEGSHGYILPTYTAMLELRAILADRGAVESFWEQ